MVVAERRELIGWIREWAWCQKWGRAEQREWVAERRASDG